MADDNPFYVVHHGLKANDGFDPAHHYQLGRVQIHFINDLCNSWGLKYVPGDQPSEFTPIAPPVTIVSGTGRRFREIAKKFQERLQAIPECFSSSKNEDWIKRAAEFSSVPIFPDPFLGGPEQVYADSTGKLKVAVGMDENGEVEVFDREQCYLFDDSPALASAAWSHMQEINAKRPGSKILSSGRRLLLMLGTKPEDIENGALFRIMDLTKREPPVRLRGY